MIIIPCAYLDYTGYTGTRGNPKGCLLCDLDYMGYKGTRGSPEGCLLCALDCKGQSQGDPISYPTSRGALSKFPTRPQIYTFLGHMHTIHVPPWPPDATRSAARCHEPPVITKCMQGNDCALVLTPSPLQLRLEGVADISQAQYAGGDETDETAFYPLATTPPTVDPVSLEEECAIPETQTAPPSKGVKALRVLRPPAFLVARAWDYTLTTANPISPWPPPPPHLLEHLLEPVNNWLAHWSQLAKNFPRSTKRNQHCQKPTVANRNPYAALALLNGKSSSKPSSSNLAQTLTAWATGTLSTSTEITGNASRQSYHTYLKSAPHSMPLVAWVIP